MQSGNAVDWFVDRHLSEGGATRLAFRDPWRSLTYAELAAESARFAGALLQAGIERERRVVLLLQDTVDFPIAFWGAMRAGAVPVPVNTLLTAETVSYILADSRADAVVMSAGLIETLGGAISRAGLHHVIVSQPEGPTSVVEGSSGFAAFLAGGDPDTRGLRLTKLHSGFTRPAQPVRRRACGTFIRACASQRKPMERRCWGSALTM